jgi:hypothetical protein
VDVVLTVQTERAAEDLRSLWEWLTDEDDLRGRVRWREVPPASGTLGGVLDGLEVAVGAAATGLASVLVAWVRTRVGGMRLRVTRPDGASVELTATGVAGLDADGLARQVGQVAGFLAGIPADAGGETAAGAGSRRPGCDGGAGPPEGGVGGPASAG